MPTKQEMISDLAFKAWPFSYDFNFACKDGWVNTTTCKYYFPFVANSTITNCCKELCLKCGRVLDPSYPSFLIILKCCQLYWKLLCFSLLLVTVCRSVFDQPFRRLLQLSCFYNGSSQWLFKVKITCKRVNFMKK